MLLCSLLARFHPSELSLKTNKNSVRTGKSVLFRRWGEVFSFWSEHFTHYKNLNNTSETVVCELTTLNSSCITRNKKVPLRVFAQMTRLNFIPADPGGQRGCEILCFLLISSSSSSGVLWWLTN